ncbi:hypothetical protein ACWDTT_02820 [Streptosporangium sandarakinum]
MDGLPPYPVAILLGPFSRRHPVQRSRGRVIFLLPAATDRCGAMMFRYEFGVVEWLWDLEAIRVNMPGSGERKFSGSYDEVVAVLSELGGQGWDVATCAANGNWLFWTLRRQH